MAYSKKRLKSQLPEYRSERQYEQCPGSEDELGCLETNLLRSLTNLEIAGKRFAHLGF